MHVAIYARYSSDNQREASITDQLRLCHLHAEKQGWFVVEDYTDHAISGASLLRPGIQALMADATRGRFQFVLAEAMDRLSRDQEDIAGLFKRMAFAGVKIVTLSEGEVSHLHIGLKGTMNALFLKDLADKTRRGLRGRVELGKSGGGKSYGYDVVKKLDGNGERIRGDRAINETEAEIVRRIFRDYIAGKSPKRIAVELNNDGIPAPGGSAWGFTTINGNRQRGIGILNNELYVGRLVWNRQRFIKDPDTGKRQARMNPDSEWITHHVPELRILDDDLWEATKAKQGTLKLRKTPDGDGEENHFRDRRRPKHLFSGLARCSCCDGGYSMISADLMGCSTARNKGTCDNRQNIRRDRFEKRVLGALRHHMMDPALFREFCDEFTRETNRLRVESSAGITAAKSELARIDRQITTTVDAIADGMFHPSMKEKMDGLESRKSELIHFLKDAQEPPPLLHPEMATYYRVQVAKLYEALQHNDDNTRIQAGGVLRSLVSEIVLTPGEDELLIDLRGDLAGILSLSLKSKTPAPLMRAGVPDPFGSQFEMVAGACNQRKLLLVSGFVERLAA